MSGPLDLAEVVLQLAAMSAEEKRKAAASLRGLAGMRFEQPTLPATKIMYLSIARALEESADADPGGRVVDAQPSVGEG